ncbi:hypothetical protein AZF37_07420 [endosymbiont 'TC1' of Trimyema compressum]|uniref:hypothetical protein n=1 Tax=endosymbiont 'TC1' of Trimyema compressum TaxID=243899 RepID=UPI0007F09CAD|nr:hypothetical protein [endosymbiont 'TC1' of Trimyema compressum]AMP21013.1 hypothetical protein AZF37_07420 [endosymbiont 'TC1' of Trimyema compressum]
MDGSDVPFEHQIFNQDLVPISLFSTPEGWDYINEHGGGRFYLLAHVDSLENINEVEIEKGLSQLGGKIPVITTGVSAKTDIPLHMALLKKLV